MPPSQPAVALVTGAAQGIGEATARRLAAAGIQAVIADISPTGQEVADSIAAAGHRATFVRCDLTIPDDVQALGTLLRARFGALDILVNNAGWTPNEPFLSQDPATWQRIIAINYLAVLHTCRALIPLMPDGAAIVNVASDAARLGVPREAVYAGAKAAVIGFSKSLAAELASRRIRVNVVSPGTTLTPLVRDMLSDEQIARRVRSIPLGRLAEPEDVAEVIVLFATGAAYVTGQVLSVNGGSSRPG
jgi:2-hydroxycyclohexanecarboxyl-CoA dehydrogenase